VTPIERAKLSLDGLSVGDAFGETFFDAYEVIEPRIRLRELPEPAAMAQYKRGGQLVWPFTDDTNMALSIVDCLKRFGRIDQDWLAKDFAKRYVYWRGYGPAMNGFLERVKAGADWKTESHALFNGTGSLGNGSAMRVAPLGAYYAGDVETAAKEAALSSEVTHAHPEGIAGAVAVAVAAALAWEHRDESLPPADFIERVRKHVPNSRVEAELHRAGRLPSGSSVQLAVSVLGNGVRITAMDTVPFCIWCAAQWQGDYEEAMWQTVSGLGDRDTACAIVGGIVALSAKDRGIPDEWLQLREPLPRLGP
jgi:ADP-ribosylglycohydrolase